MTLKCVICEHKVHQKYKHTPYWICPNCDVWFQHPQPPKTYEGPHEKDHHGNSTGHLMSDEDKGANAWVAKFVVEGFNLQPGAKTLDIGAKYPYLAHCLRVNHGMESYAMDNIDVVDEYAASLEVPMLQADFEKINKKQIEEWTKTKKFDMISMVHCFEHMYKPMDALKKLRDLLADDGHLYIRSPDHGVAGFERDLTDNHYTIHPFFHSNVSLLECLVQSKDLFVLDRYMPVEGYGQSDWFLRPIKRKPMIVAGMIVKNEERDLPKCLKSIARVVDSVVIVDTGSTDNTEKVAKNTIYAPVHYSHYHGASKQDETGDWKLWDFGKARNEFVKKVEALDADWCLWMDADDVLQNQENLVRACYWYQNEVYGINIKSGGATWIHHRLWQTKKNVIFQGRCHEYPKMDGLNGMNLKDVLILHDAAPGIGETSNVRNLRILEEEMAEAPSTRTAFYLANTHSDGGRHEKAVEAYNKRIELGEGYRDELLFAYLYKARNLRALDRKVEAILTLLEAIALEHSWAEFWMELSYIYAETNQPLRSIGTAMYCIDMAQPYTQLWRETDKYTDQPLRMISWGYQNLDRLPDALEYAFKAKVAIGVPDADWDKRITELQQMLVAKSHKKVAFHRPGAIGDVIMTLNLVRTFKAKNPHTQVHYYTQIAGLEELMAAAGVDQVFVGQTPDASKYTKVINLVGYPLAEGYPEVPMKKHLLEYFGAEMGLNINPKDLPTMNLRKPDPLPIESGYVTIHPKAGWSEYKNWPQERWEEIIATTPGIKFIQIGAADDPKLVGADHQFMGAPLETTIRLMAHARFHLGVDSFTNHLSHINWEGGKTRAIILWGSTQPTAAGYPHNINIWKHLPCSPCFRETSPQSTHPRGPCIYPVGVFPSGYAIPKCQDDITVKEVLDEVKQLSEATR